MDNQVLDKCDKTNRTSIGPSTDEKCEHAGERSDQRSVGACRFGLTRHVTSGPLPLDVERAVSWR